MPIVQGFVFVDSRRYAEWLNLAYQAATDQGYHQVDLKEENDGSLVERPQYKIPSGNLQPPRIPVAMMNMPD